MSLASCFVPFVPLSVFELVADLLCRQIHRDAFTKEVLL